MSGFKINNNIMLGNTPTYNGTIDWTKGLSLGNSTNNNVGVKAPGSASTSSTGGNNSGKLNMGNMAMSAIPMVTGALGALNDYTKRNMTDLQKTEFNAIYGRGEDPIFDLFHLGRDAKNTASLIKNTAYTNTGVLGSNQDLLNTYNSFDFDSWKSNDDRIDFMQANLKNLEASGKGASMGSTFGPWGALIGGIIGGVADLGSYIGSRKRRNLINDAKEMTKDLSLASWKEQQNNTNKQMNLSNYRNMKFYDMGGALDYGLLNLYALNSYVNALNRSKITSMPNSFYKPQFNSMNYFAMGGMPDFNEFNTGGTHELNPNGGIPQGMDNLGVMNTVELGETKTTTPNGDYIFSDRLKLSKEECKQLGVPKDSTYAEASKILRKEYDEMPNDDIARRGWEQSRDMLIQSLEMQKQEIALKEARKQGLNSSKMQGVNPQVMQDMYYNENPQEEVLLQQGINPDIPYAFGGLVRKFARGSFLNYENPPGVNPDLNYEYFPMLFLYDKDLGTLNNHVLLSYDDFEGDPELPDVTSRVEAVNDGWGTSDHFKNVVDRTKVEPLMSYDPIKNKKIDRLLKNNNNNNTFNQENLKYAPIAANIVGLALNLFTPEDYSIPNRLLKEIDLLPRVSVSKNTNYMTYNPVDINRYINQYNASAAAQRNAIMNTSNSNRNAALASAIYNANIGYGDLVQAIESQNAKEKQAVLKFNADIDQLNIANQLQADGINQQYEQMRIEGIMQELAWRDAIQTARANAIQSNLKGLTDNMYNVYLDDQAKRQAEIWHAGLVVPPNLKMLYLNKSINELLLYTGLKNQGYDLTTANSMMASMGIDVNNLKWE